MIFYADVYFLINFTVDTIALYFAVSVSKTTTSVRRILLLSALGALLAMLTVLFFEVLIFEFLISALFFIAVFVFVSRRISFYRRVKVTVLFAVFEALLGGVVSFGYNFLDRHFYSAMKDSDLKAPDRRLLILAVMVLISIGVFKLLIAFFSHTVSERSVMLEINLLGKRVTVEALVDTGNLLRDTVSASPVILLKPNTAKKIHKDFPTDTSCLSKITKELENRISLIPVRTVAGGAMLVGLRADEINILHKNKTSVKHSVKAVIASDKEGGTYDGYEALMPAAALDDA